MADNLGGKIEEILRAIEKIGAGELNVNIPISEKKDEYDALAMSINIMAEEIRAKGEELEAAKKDLEEKVEQLKRINKLMVGRELRMAEMRKEIEELKNR